jgi:hypothetical protein
MTITKRLPAALLATAIGATGFLTAQAWAAPITPSPTITSGNITFDNFTCSTSAGASLSCSNISVIAHTSTNPPDATTGDNGIRIQGSFTSGLTSEDVALTYDATISGKLFHDASMYFNGTATSSISEMIYDEEVGTADYGKVIGQLEVSNPPAVFTDDILLKEDVNSIYVVKDIGLNFTSTTPATISIADQNFSQVPEPMSLTLFGTSLIGLGAIRRRRQQKQA